MNALNKVHLFHLSVFAILLITLTACSGGGDGGDGVTDDDGDATENVDTTAPVITMLGDNPVEVALGATYNDPGISVEDDVDGNINDFDADTSSVNTDVLGSYIVTYTASDLAGNTAEGFRTVIVTTDIVTSFTCSDGIDNDGDGETDFPNDPGCTDANDNDETDPVTFACSDGIDNDGDGETDFPNDPGCTDANDNDETDPATFACSDGVDNDSDGETDFPNDPGCNDATDDDEIDPASSEPGVVSLVNSVTHDGVTINFASLTEVGHFIDGYPYCVDECTVTGYTPEPVISNERDMHGCLVNPQVGQKVGFDGLNGGGFSQYVHDPDMNCARHLPITLEGGDSMMISVSKINPEDAMRAADRFTLLTCVDEIPPADAFRPAYADSSFKTIYRLAEVDTSKLKNIEVVGTPPSWEGMEERLSRFTPDIAATWLKQHLESANGPLYGRDVMGYEHDVALMLNTDYPMAQKQKALIGLIQRGIDRYGLFKSNAEGGGIPWQADGGHNSGRKFSIVFAGALLGNQDMLEVWKQTGRATDIESRAQFHEDSMTFYVTQTHVDATNSGGWNPPYGDTRPHQPYSSEMIGMPDWRGYAGSPDITDASWLGHAYRLSPNHGSQHPQALALVVMGLQEAWGNQAYFDYHARYIEIMSNRPDPWGTQRGPALSYPPVVGSVAESGLTGINPSSYWDDDENWEGWHVYWHNPFAWEMIQHHWYDYYSFPWE